MIQTKKSTVSLSQKLFASERNRMIRHSFNAGPFTTPLQNEMEIAYERQVHRFGRLLRLYANGDPAAENAIKMFGLKQWPLNAPPKWLTDSQDRAAARDVSRVISQVSRTPGIPENVASEFIHTMSDFPTLTLACVTRAFERLSDEGICADTCLDPVFFTRPAQPYCENKGKVGIMPIKAPPTAGCPDGDCGDEIGYWQFGEVTRGDFISYLYRDHIMWGWELSECMQYGGFTDEMISWILRIQEERRLEQRASLFANINGINDSIFNATHGNIILAQDDTPNPSITCEADAISVFERHAKTWAYHTDLDGLDVCVDRPLHFITADWDVFCAASKAQGAEVISKSRLEDPATGDCVYEIETNAAPCMPNMTVCYSRKLRRAMGNDSRADNAYFIVPEAGTGITDRSAFEEAAIQGFEQTQLAQKVNMWRDLSGRSLDRFGSDYQWNQEVMAVRGYGVGSIYPEYAFASKGTDAA